MISGQVNESPGPLAHRSRACVEGDSGAAGGQSRANSGRTLPSKSHGPSAKQPGVTRPLTTPALVRPRKPCSVPWLPPREPHSLPAEHGLPFHFLKTSSAPLSRPPVDGACPTVVGTWHGHPSAPGTQPPGGRALPRSRAKCTDRGAPEVRQPLQPRCKTVHGGSRVPRPQGTEAGGSGCPSRAAEALVLAPPKSMDWSSRAPLCPRNLTISISTPIKM